MCVVDIKMLIEPITYTTQNDCFELQEKLRVGLHSTEVADGSIPLNLRLSSDPLWWSKTLQKQETSSSFNNLYLCNT